MPDTSPDVDAYLDALDHPLAAEVRSLRGAILALDDRITERIKMPRASSSTVTTGSRSRSARAGASR